MTTKTKEENKESSGNEVGYKKPPKHSQWKKGQTGNPNGTPRKGIGAVNNALLEAGFTPVSKIEIEAHYMSILNCDQQRLTEILEDKTLPMLARIVAKQVLSGKGFDVAERMIDRAHGKATQKEEIKHSGEVGVIDYTSLTPKQLEEKRAELL